MEEIMIGREMNPKEMIPEEENQEGQVYQGHERCGPEKVT